EDLKNIDSGTQIIISHQERILNIADEIVVIANGKIREYGTKEEILPKLLAGESNAGCPVERRANV
ncbi:MAG: ABC transporter ATP-binding protein, partial [Clostridia bacterium]|nr:ABC transporter ATP-binding protein [Clostridia bacterium]